MGAMMVMMIGAVAGDSNGVYSPCEDAKVQKSDGFTIGLAFSKKESFSFQNVQLSPCDSRLGLAKKGAKLAVFRPKVDEISLLTINGNTTLEAGGYMVAFAGRKYAARSLPIMVADANYTITRFTLVMEFKQGTLQNLYWKSSGCDSCSGKSATCLNKQDCARPTPKCGQNGCSLGIQSAFSGTDKNLEVLNSWYEVSKLRQQSLIDLYSDLRDKFFYEMTL
ncbi:B3 domain-containing protein [Hibiscus syriacus]|uniref:B3 domain-containing protein n=1 Tax=Hibiscus syriacus TaxID=106335 RepID=A0A6A3C5T4_HIBSY|nr:B3 domain-containing protein [Hibiscus syriacus]